jgi:ubiquinone/menaquinone biosynthesis C-methylase UbiE/Fe2+ or Zn2+ uptake regulation protein
MSGDTETRRGELTIKAAVTALKAAAEPTRLRILLLLSHGEWNVKDLTHILGQSQPRVSRHLRLLNEAGLVDRFREGSWVYFHLAGGSDHGRLGRLVVDAIDFDDPLFARDRERAESLKVEREAKAQAYFREHAAEWDKIRALHVAEGEVEAAMREALGTDPVNLLIDLGTGTGRILELFSDCYARGLGIDANQAMLAYARSKLRRAGLTRAQVRHGDIYDLSVGEKVADAVVMHQVLHFLADPGRAICEAARALAPGGRLLIVDFAPHDIEFLRERFAHERLGFSGSQISQWLGEAGLTLVQTRDLAPPTGSGPGKLTVKLWLAAREREANAPVKSPIRTLESMRPLA